MFGLFLPRGPTAPINWCSCHLPTNTSTPPRVITLPWSQFVSVWQPSLPTSNPLNPTLPRHDWGDLHHLSNPAFSHQGFSSSPCPNPSHSLTPPSARLPVPFSPCLPIHPLQHLSLLFWIPLRHLGADNNIKDPIYPLPPGTGPTLYSSFALCS